MSLTSADSGETGSRLVLEHLKITGRRNPNSLAHPITRGVAAFVVTALRKSIKYRNSVARGPGLGVLLWTRLLRPVWKSSLAELAQVISLELDARRPRA